METDSGRIEENGYTSFPKYTEGFLCPILGCIYRSYHTDQEFFFFNVVHVHVYVFERDRGRQRKTEIEETI